MVKEKEKEKKEKKILVGLIYTTPDIKFLLSSILVIFILFTTFQFLPYKSLLLSPSTLYSRLSNPSSSTAPRLPQTSTLNQEPYPSNLTTKRSFNPIGSAAYLFVQMGSYRGGPNTFSVIGLASKPIHVYSNPVFKCRWIPHDNTSNEVEATSYKMLPDWGYGRVYTVVVVNCTFATNVGSDGSGGRLAITATGGGGESTGEEFVSLEEKPGMVNMSLFTSPPEYDYLYCGSPLYGNLSPQRVREWIAYHVKLFGEKSHFVIHDAGGVHDEVMEVLRPWIGRGVLTLQDVRGQERFDGYYHNQFLVVNDCLHRYRHVAKWVFFFDVDEFIYVEPRMTIDGFMSSMERFTQFTIEQIPMSSKLCLSDDLGKTGRMWGIEKLVYRDVKRGIRHDRKYAIQPRNAYSAGVHLSQNFAGKTTHKTEGKIKYYHYHGTIASRREPCNEFVNATNLWNEGTPYYRDETLRGIVGSVKMFEIKNIGRRLVRTRQ